LLRLPEVVGIDAQVLPMQDATDLEIATKTYQRTGVFPGNLYNRQFPEKITWSRVSTRKKSAFLCPTTTDRAGLEITINFTGLFLINWVTTMFT
jgi:hypothetical protein